MSNTYVAFPGTSPVGVALFPKIVTPDYKFTPEGMYSIRLRVPEDEAGNLIAAIDKIAEEAYQNALEAAVTPKQKAKVKRADAAYSEELDDDGTPTGYILFNFKMKASGVSAKTGKAWSRKPVLFDAAGCPIVNPDFDVWGGTVCRVAYELVPYQSPSFGCGCSVKLAAVQILELRSGMNRSADDYGFKAVDGFTHTAKEEPKEEAVESFDDFDGEY